MSDDRDYISSALVDTHQKVLTGVGTMAYDPEMHPSGVNLLLRDSVNPIFDGTRGNPDMLTLRDQFAMAAVSGLIKRHRADVAWSQIAPLAYEMADAMMEARKR